MSSETAVFLIGDDEATGGLVASIAESLDVGFHHCACSQDVENASEDEQAGCVVVDQSSAAGVWPSVNGSARSFPVLVLGEPNDAHAAVAAMRRGAFDYLEKPVGREKLSEAIEAAVQDALYRTECRRALNRIRRRLGELSEHEREALEFAATSVLRSRVQRNGSWQVGSAKATVSGGNGARSRQARRRNGASPSGPREGENTVADMADDKAASLYESLTPRLRQTLDLLLLGDSEKQVAFRMGLSRHTVHDYVKALYRHFGVQSRAELMATCLAAAAL